MTRICDDCKQPFDAGQPVFAFMLRCCNACVKLRAERVAARLAAQEWRK